MEIIRSSRNPHWLRWKGKTMGVVWWKLKDGAKNGENCKWRSPKKVRNEAEGKEKRTANEHEGDRTGQMRLFPFPTVAPWSLNLIRFVRSFPISLSTRCVWNRCITGPVRLVGQIGEVTTGWKRAQWNRLGSARSDDEPITLFYIRQHSSISLYWWVQHF